MKLTATRYSIAQLTEGFTFDSIGCKGTFGLNGQLVIQPPYQRNYVYGKGGRDAAVIDSVLDGYDIGQLYFVRNAAGQLEILDGQQRVTSLGRFVTGDLSSQGRFIDSLDADKRERFLAFEIDVKIGEGTEEETKEWFKRINIVGVPLNPQELLNAAYSGPFISAARAVLSNPKNDKHDERAVLIKGDANRQDHLATALAWISDGKISEYLAKHRKDANAEALVMYCDTVVAWALNLFGDEPGKHVCGLNWGKLHSTHKDTPYDRQHLQTRVKELLADERVTKPAGVYEFLLGGEKDARLLAPRCFGPDTIRVTYHRQTLEAEKAGHSNCPDCAAQGKTTIHHPIEAMEADHITAWANGGRTTDENCQMLCRAHNRMKGAA